VIWYREKKRDARTGDLIYIYGGNRFKDGYLIKTVSLKVLEIGGIQPTLEELQKFESAIGKEGEEGDEDTLLPHIRKEPAGMTSKKVHFSKGDFVKVISGDLKGLMGTVDVVDGETVTVLPQHKDLDVRYNYKLSPSHSCTARTFAI